MRRTVIYAAVVLAAHCLAFVSSQTEDNTFLQGECSLCGSDALELPVVYRTQNEVGFQGCCSPLEDEGDCRGVTETKRTAAFEGPLVVPGVEELCLELSDLVVEEEETKDRTCCPKQCTCSDGFCTSFQGEKVYAGACDARREGGCCGLSVCVFDKSLCESLTDTKGEPCEWVGESDEDLCLTTGFGPAEVSFFDRPCRAKNPTDTLLYRVTASIPDPDGSGRRLQSSIVDVSRREVIDGSELNFVLQGQRITIRSRDCFNRQKLRCSSNQLRIGGLTFNNYVRCLVRRRNPTEERWEIRDDSGPRRFTLIFTCKNIAAGDDRRRLQSTRNELNVDGIEQPDLSLLKDEYGEVQQEGFCYNSEPNPDVEVNPSLGPACDNVTSEDVQAARGICQSGNIQDQNTRDGESEVDSCYAETFCPTFGLPGFGTIQDCVSCFVNFKDKTKCFCQAMVLTPNAKKYEKMFMECQSRVREDGWSKASEFYINGYSTKKVQEASNLPCIDNLQELNKTLGGCEDGVILQYKNKKNEWIDYRAIPFRRKLCPDLKVCLSDGREEKAFLSAKQIRFKQGYNPDCYKCRPRPGFKMSYNVDAIVPTPAPTIMPTPQRGPPRPGFCQDVIENIVGMPQSSEAPGNFRRIKERKDVVWLIHEPKTDMQMKIRCTATFRGGKAYNYRIGIEELVEPTPRRKGPDAAGFCMTGEISERIGTTENTDQLESSGDCHFLPDDTRASQAICRRYIQAGDGVEKCRKAFCAAHWFPFYSDKDACIRAIRASWERGFCGAFHAKDSVDYLECLEDAADFAMEDVIYENRPNLEGQCSSDPKDFDTSLSECQQGVELQYFNEKKGAWISYKAFPSETNRRVCQGGLEFNAKQHKQLFQNRIRLHQRNIPKETCLLSSPCVVTQQVRTELEYSRSTSCNNGGEPSPVEPFDVPDQTLCDKVNPSEMGRCKPIPKFTNSPGRFTVDMVEMPKCCAPSNTTINDASFMFQRTQTTCNPICDSNDAGSCCDKLGKQDTLTVRVGFSGSTRDGTCCLGCTCYGDPRCISFAGKRKAWIPCDARDVTTALESDPRVCRYTKRQCDLSKDHEANDCVWTRDAVEVRGNDILKTGTPCKPNTISRKACMLMYRVVEPGFELGFYLVQGDRGIITDLVMPYGDDVFVLNAQECLKDKTPWKALKGALPLP